MKKRKIRAVFYLALFTMSALMVCGCSFPYGQLASEKTDKKIETMAYDAETEEENISTENKNSMTENENISTENGKIDTDSTYTVILDAGHGGLDEGAKIGGVNEKDINLSMTLLLQEKLEGRGIAVINTRVQDEKVFLDERIALANAGNADLFISIHCDSYKDDTSVYGFQCFYDKSSTVGKSLSEQISAAVENGNITKVRNAKTGNYKVTRETAIPAVLLEIGYLTNKQERSNLTSGPYLEKMADCIVSGILAQIDEGKGSV